MTDLPNPADPRLARLAQDAVRRLQLDLGGLSVLTEAATGPFALTAVMAALAGASDVLAVARDSRWGLASEAVAQVRLLARACGVESAIRFAEGHAEDLAAGHHVVTNLGFVRPISRRLVGRLSPCAAIALMWEPWEFRAEEIDLPACRDHAIPVIGTNEAHPLVRTLDYMGPVVGRLLLDHGIEIVNSRLVLVGSDPFGQAVESWLVAAGAEVLRTTDWATIVQAMPTGEAVWDAVVLVEHRDDRALAGAGDEAALERLAEWGSPIVRVCGTVDAAVIRSRRVVLIPDAVVPPGFMTVTTAHAGARPVADLHGAGLKAASLIAHARASGMSLTDSVALAVQSGYGLRLEGSP